MARLTDAEGPDTDINLHVYPPAARRSTVTRGSATACGPTRPTGALNERTTRALAGRDWTYMQQYADAKSDVVEEILRRA